MTQRHLSGILATGAAVLVAVAACGTNPSTKPPSASPTQPSVSATTTSPSTAASTEASALMRRYFAVVDGIRKSPSTPIDQLSSVAISTQLAAEQHLISSERAQGDRQIGDTRVAVLKVQAVNLDNSNPSAGAVPTVTIDVCWDVNTVDVIDRSGHSIVSPSRAARGWTRYLVANYRWATDPAHGWRVASGQDLGKEPCAAR